MKIKNNVSVSESGFLFDGNTGESYSLNPSAREITILLNEGKTMEEVQAVILSKYEITPEAFERYFDDFSQMLNHYHLIEKEG